MVPPLAHWVPGPWRLDLHHIRTEVGEQMATEWAREQMAQLKNTKSRQRPSILVLFCRCVHRVTPDVESRDSHSSHFVYITVYPRIRQQRTQ